MLPRFSFVSCVELLVGHIVLIQSVRVVCRRRFSRVLGCVCVCLREIIVYIHNNTFFFDFTTVFVSTLLSKLHCSLAPLRTPCWALSFSANKIEVQKHISNGARTHFQA